MTPPRTALVTGANSGIGLETARGLARAGYRTIMLCRDANRAVVAKADIDASVPGADAQIVLCDLALQGDVRRAATDIGTRVDALDVLVNNAGMKMRTRAETTEGVDTMLAVNHLGPFLLTNLLLPLLQTAPSARIVNVASAGHKLSRLRLDDLQATRGYGLHGFPRYGETKLMNILFTRELARRLSNSEITVNAVHPGLVRTNFLSVPTFVKATIGALVLSAEQGAQTSLAAATDPVFADVSGSYFVKGKPADDKLSKAARDDRAATELWRRSAELVGLDADD